MNFWERIKIAVAMFRRLGGIELPDTGRSSDESLGGQISAFNAGFGSLSPVIDFEMLKTLKCFWLYNPDFSQYIANIVNLGNPGHQLSVDAATDAIAEKAIARLNESASRIYTHGAGVDSLINQYLTSVAWSGAIASEDVINFAAQRVERVVLVPVEQIRFRYNKDTDLYDPYQRLTNFLQRTDGNRNSFGLIPLNQETFKYFSLSTVENSPYAKPPGTAAVQAILEGQVPIMENIRFMAQKIGLLGFLSASVTPPPKKPSETDAEYQIRAKNYLSIVTKSLEGNFNKGLAVTFRDQKLEHTKVSEGASDVYDLNRLSEEQVFSGLAAQPGFHGRTDSTTETFASVVYYLLTAQTANMQRLVARRQERTYMLDLRFGGIDVNGVTLTFNKAHSLNAYQEAQTKQIDWAVIKDKVLSGLIAPDEGAQELGQETWFDEGMLAAGVVPKETAPAKNLSRHKPKTLTLKFHKESQQYRYQPETIELWSGEETEAADNVVTFLKKKAQ